MWKYVLKRLLWTVVVCLGVAFIIFTILYFTPGDPAEMLLGTTATEAEKAAKRAALGLDQPYLVQLYKFYYQTFIKFDLGTSWLYEQPVIVQLSERLPRTILMNLASMIITVIVGFPLGISAALHQGKWQDYGLIGASMILISLPGFWVSLMCVLLFSAKLGWLPSHGIGGIEYYVLPVISAAIGGIAGNARQARSAMLEVIRADYITTARAKGQEEQRIIYKHMLPNAMLPLITMLGGRFAGIVSGSAITERIFSIPGVGLFMLNGITYRDYPIIRGCTLFFALFAAICVLLTDLCYAWVDPRIKAQYKSGGRK